MGVILLLLLAVILLATIGQLWISFARARYALPDQGTLHRVVTRDGWTLTVRHFPAETRRFIEPIVLCHGLANNQSFLAFHALGNLTGFLGKLGFDCYAVDLRGSASAVAPEWFDDSDFDSFLIDAEDIIAWVTKREGVARVMWLGHSLGGLVGLVTASSKDSRISGLCTIASPVELELPPFARWLLKLASWLSVTGTLPLSSMTIALSPFVGGYIPQNVRLTANIDNLDRAHNRSLMATVFESVPHGLLVQMSRWASEKKWTSVDGRRDYTQETTALRIPLLIIGGTQDNLCPEVVTRRYFERMTSTDKTLLIMGKSAGASLDYGHGDLIIGMSAPAEVYPPIGDWFTKRATPRGTERESR